VGRLLRRGSRAKLDGIAAAITIEVLPAGYGDALWIGCVGDGPPWRTLIDKRDRAFRELGLLGGPRITLLFATPRRLLALSRVWDQALSQLRRGESEEPEPPNWPEPLTDLAARRD
jgi:hypothetical protein